MTTLDSERRLNIALVGHGRLEIPPKAWGAVEEVIWKYACHLQARGHTTPIINERWHKVPRHLIREHRKKPLDWVWVHNEKAIFGALVASKICGFRVVATSHSPYDPFGPQTPLVRKQFGRLKRAPYHLTLTRDQGFAVSVMRPDGCYALQYNGNRCRGN